VTVVESDHVSTLTSCQATVKRLGSVRPQQAMQLRSLRELARRGTMAAVAEAISLTLSAVSQQLANLERQAGVRLLERDGRRVRLTTAGRVLAARADLIIGALQEAAEEVAALDRDAAGVLRVASFPSVAAALCPTLISAFRERHPRHQVRLSESEPAASITALVSDDVDLAIVDEPFIPLADQHSVIAHRELLADPLYCVLPADHPHAKRHTIDLRDMAAETWVMDPPDLPVLPADRRPLPRGRVPTERDREHRVRQRLVGPGPIRCRDRDPARPGPREHHGHLDQADRPADHPAPLRRVP
jgi:DNA-binding transcriptional LysR family regulator